MPSRDDKLRGTEPPELEPNPQYTVLVVEDEAPVRLAVVEYLRDRDFQVLEAANGVEAVNILSADTAVDVVCSHVQMAGDLSWAEPDATATSDPPFPADAADFQDWIGTGTLGLEPL